MRRRSDIWLIWEMLVLKLVNFARAPLSKVCTGTPCFQGGLAVFSGFNGLWTQDLCLMYRLVVVQRNNCIKKHLLSWKTTAAVQLLTCAASAWLTLLFWQASYGDEAGQ